MFGWLKTKKRIEIDARQKERNAYNKRRDDRFESTHLGNKIHVIHEIGVKDTISKTIKNLTSKIYREVHHKIVELAIQNPEYFEIFDAYPDDFHHKNALVITKEHAQIAANEIVGKLINLLEHNEFGFFCSKCNKKLIAEHLNCPFCEKYEFNMSSFSMRKYYASRNKSKS